MDKALKQASIEIYYEKNPLYRTIYADGLIGGITPAKGFNLTFYATRNPIPKSTIHEINSEGGVNPIGVASNDSKFGIIREIEVGVYMNKETAKDIYEFLKNIFENEK
jgi:hypothetical protein